MMTVFHGFRSSAKADSLHPWLLSHRPFGAKGEPLPGYGAAGRDAGR